MKPFEEAKVVDLVVEEVIEKRMIMVMAVVS
jgi:hypothetical protein